MKRILFFICIIIHNLPASFIGSAKEFAKETHTVATVKPVKELQDKFLYLLQKNSADWVRMETEDELAQTFLGLTLLKHFRPDEFKKYGLQKLLTECLIFVGKTELPDTLHFVELHAYLDFWYFAHHYKKEYLFSLSPEVVKKHINKKMLAQVTTPFDAFLSWTYLTILAHCDPKPYRRLQRYKKRLKKIIEQDVEMHGYLVTHELFYTTQFGKKNLRKKKKFEKQLAHYLKITKEIDLSLSLRAQLITCLKLIEKGESPAAQIIASTLRNAFSETVLESCMLTVAAA